MSGKGWLRKFLGKAEGKIKWYDFRIKSFSFQGI
jgi:hypothetical protein